MRLQKFIAKSGIASRRKAEELIKNGKIKVNDRIITEMGVKIDPQRDIIKYNNKRLSIENEKKYIILNKPEGYITTVSDQFGRPTVMDLIKDIKERVYPVGRLDYNTSGLLLLTNDGNLTHKITHPKSQIKKTYIAKIKGIISNSKMNRFKNGIDIGGYITAPAQIKLINKKNGCSIVKIIIHEGKNRQIRRMMDKIGHPVLELKRVAIGKITLDNLPKGQWRYLTESEINYLKTV